MISIALSGERAAVLRFEEFPERLRARLRVRLASIEARLAAAVVAAEPDRTGALRRATGGAVYEHPNRIAAVVGVRIDPAGPKYKGGSRAAAKAAALEYGSSKTAAVPPYRFRLDHFWKRKVEERWVAVHEAFKRGEAIAARRYLRGPLEALRGEFLAELEAAVAEAAAESNG